jgi:hypothetical protein
MEEDRSARFLLIVADAAQAAYPARLSVPNMFNEVP